MPATPFVTTHRHVIGDARALGPAPGRPGLADRSVHLVVTSPPYPMVAMWDAPFAALDPAVGDDLARGDGMAAFERMHRQLDDVWAECHRVLVDGGFACINIGDATRTLGEFCLYPNHARILTAAMRTGFTPLPDILWRKPNNAPNKFMGSGMLPAGAYVTYEHEYILILRKGGKRTFDEPGRAVRARSACFWEERNAWFSDLWSDLRGAGQAIPRRARATDPSGTEPGDVRDRSAAYPFELPYRLIQMYSLQGDVVLDPFAGTGTTLAAAAASGRSSVGVEVEPGLASLLREAVQLGVRLGRDQVVRRLGEHERFVRARVDAGKPPGHVSGPYGFPVVTGQEATLQLSVPLRVVTDEAGCVTVEHGLDRPRGVAILGG